MPPRPGPRPRHVAPRARPRRRALAGPTLHGADRTPTTVRRRPRRLACVTRVRTDTGRENQYARCPCVRRAAVNNV